MPLIHVSKQDRKACNSTAPVTTALGKTGSTPFRLLTSIQVALRILLTTVLFLVSPGVSVDIILT